MWILTNDQELINSDNLAKIKLKKVVVHDTVYYQVVGRDIRLVSYTVLGQYSTKEFAQTAFSHLTTMLSNNANYMIMDIDETLPKNYFKIDI